MQRLTRLLVLDAWVARADGWSDSSSLRECGLNWAQPRYTDGSGGQVWLITNRAVRATEELLVEYGAK
jgi:hypothetical protein